MDINNISRLSFHKSGAPLEQSAHIPASILDHGRGEKARKSEKQEVYGLRTRTSFTRADKISGKNCFNWLNHLHQYEIYTPQDINAKKNNRAWLHAKGQKLERQCWRLEEKEALHWGRGQSQEPMWIICTGLSVWLIELWVVDRHTLGMRTDCDRKG